MRLLLKMRTVSNQHNKYIWWYIAGDVGYKIEQLRKLRQRARMICPSWIWKWGLKHVQNSGPLTVSVLSLDYIVSPGPRSHSFSTWIPSSCFRTTTFPENWRPYLTSVTENHDLNSQCFGLIACYSCLLCVSKRIWAQL